VTNEFHHIELENLINFYHLEEASLKQALLEGASWKELQDKRKKVTQLAIAIHQKHPAYFKNQNPAEGKKDRSTSLEP
jgi:hypothetical protein